MKIGGVPQRIRPEHEGITARIRYRPGKTVYREKQ
jgi:hypothetical protein